jgi:diamine N-acetyltransferase
VVTLKGKNIILRALEPSDLIELEAIENNEELWFLSHTIQPFSTHQLKEYIDHSQNDIFVTRQLRLVISNFEGSLLGLIDLFDFDPYHKRAGVGIIIAKKEYRGKGFAKEALELLINYCFKRLLLHQVYCNILQSNTKSLHLFEACGFQRVGLKRDWNLWEGSYSNEWLLQLINSEDVH